MEKIKRMISPVRLSKLNLLTIFVIALVMRLTYLSPWLEDWDSVQFTLALSHYSISEHLPHPPGYPLYILLGKFFNLFISDGATALSLMSAVFGSLTVIPMFLLSKKAFNNNVAILASLFFILAPVHWMLSEVALTNIPGQFFLVLLVYFLHIYKNSFKGVIIISAFFGLMLGVRFTELPVILSLITLILIKNKNLKLVLFSGFSFLLGVSFWLVPLIYITGIENFISSYNLIARYILYHDSLGPELNSFDLIEQRVKNYFYFLNIAYTNYFLSIFVIGLIYLVLLKKSKIFNFEVVFLLTFLFSYAFTHLIFYNMEVTRYTLPILPPLAILTSYFIWNISRKKLAFVLTFSLLVYMFYISFDQINRFKNQIPATISPVNYVKKNFQPDKTIIISSLLS